MKKRAVRGIFAVLGIGALEFLITFLLYCGVRSGTVISVRQAAAQPAAFLLQCLRECLLPAALLLMFAVLLKKDFSSALYNDHRMAKSIENSIDFAAKRQVWQRMTQKVIRPMLIEMNIWPNSCTVWLRGKAARRKAF